MRSLSLFCFLALFSPIARVCVSACSIGNIAVDYAPNGNKNQPGFFIPANVSDHMEWVAGDGIPDFYLRDGTSMLSCVDARSEEPAWGSPGGDLAEFAMGLYIYNQLTNQLRDYASVLSLFQQFLARHISALRPFYYHTDDQKLSRVFVEVGLQLGRTVTILPPSAPPPAEKIIWLTELVKAYAQGCGHIRLMMEAPANYGLSSAQLLQWAIRAFYEEFWAADTDVKRAKLRFTIKLGSLQGKAVVIVQNKLGACSGYTPGIPANIGGSSVFIYSPAAASAFRSTIMAPFFEAQGAAGWSTPLFVSEINKLFTTQLTATLTNLAPASSCSLINVDITTIGSPPELLPPACQSDSTSERNLIIGIVGIAIGIATTVVITLAVFFRRRIAAACCPSQGSAIRLSRIFQTFRLTRRETPPAASPPNQRSEMVLLPTEGEGAPGSGLGWQSKAAAASSHQDDLV